MFCNVTVRVFLPVNELMSYLSRKPWFVNPLRAALAKATVRRGL